MVRSIPSAAARMAAMRRVARTSGGLKPWLRSGKPCGLDQPRFPWHMVRITDTPARRGFHALREGLWSLKK